jgi:hypothetical protein
MGGAIPPLPKYASWRGIQLKKHRVLIKEDEMKVACSMHGKDEKFIQNFCQKTRREETI